MAVLQIIAGIILILSVSAIGAFALINFLKGLGYPNIIIVGGCGALFIGGIFMMIALAGAWAAYVGYIFMLLGYPAVAVGFVLLSMRIWPKPTGRPKA